MSTAETAIPQSGTHAPTDGEGWTEAARLAVAQARDQLEDADRAVRGFVRERPLAAVGCALAAGFLLGRILR